MTLIVAMTIGVAIVAAAGLWRDYLYARVCSLMLRDLRAEIFDQLHRLTPSSSGSEDNAGETAHFSTDLAAIEHALVSAVPWALLPALDVAIGTTLLFMLEWRLAVIAALVFPLALIGPRIVAPRATRASRERKDQEAAVLRDVQENISARQMIRAFRLEALMRARFIGRVDHLVAGSTRTGFLGALVERSAGIGILLLQVVRARHSIRIRRLRIRRDAADSARSRSIAARR
ncbi:MAG: hypothetical protein K2Y23_06255 [Cyanobacteria bacterium]|nr:hypothetical protein [Cyanobacteriota bacterium]